MKILNFTTESMSEIYTTMFSCYQERDHLARRVKDLEMDSAHNLAMTNSLLAEVGALSAEKRYLEDRLANYHHQIPHSSHNTCFTPVKQYEVSAWLKEERRVAIAHKIGSRDLSLNDVTSTQLLVGEKAYLFTKCVWRHYVLCSSST